MIERDPARTDSRAVRTVFEPFLKRIVTAAVSDSVKRTFAPRRTAFSE